MRAGDVAQLESICQVIPDFPHGVDSWLGRRWIINAIDSGSAEVVKWMIEKGVPLVFRDDEGYTVLHACIERFDQDKTGSMHDCLRALIAADADVDLKGINDWTPLHMAVTRGDLGSIRILLEAGADRTIKTTIDDYESADDMAVRPQYAKAFKLFREIPPRKK